MTHSLFVYGTLKQAWWQQQSKLNSEAAEVVTQLHQYGQYQGEARLQGALFNLGRYPGLVLAQIDNMTNAQHPRCQWAGESGSDWVFGELWQIAPSLWPVLDRYEGIDRPPYEYKRLRVNAVLESDGSDVESWAYVMDSSRWQDELPERIASGRFEG